MSSNLLLVASAITAFAVVQLAFLLYRFVDRKIDSLVLFHLVASTYFYRVVLDASTDYGWLKVQMPGRPDKITEDSPFCQSPPNGIRQPRLGGRRT